MILSNITPRASIKGTIFRGGGGGGVTSYDQLNDKPSINGVTIEGALDGNDYGLANTSDLIITGYNTVPGESIYRLHDVTIDGRNYTVAYLPFEGTDGIDNGKVGLVPAPTAADANKFLAGDGSWKNITNDCEVIPITNGNGTNSRTFSFAKTPKFIKIFHTSPSLAFYSDASIVWGQTYYTYPSHGTFIEITGGTVPSGQITYNDNDITFAAGNAFGCFNVADSAGYMFVIY